MRSLISDLELVQSLIKHSYNDTDYLVQAFTEKAYSKTYGGHSNEAFSKIGVKYVETHIYREIY